MAESYHRSWRAWRSRLKGDGVGFATESYAASSLYTTLASLSGALWRIRRVSVRRRTKQNNRYVSRGLSDFADQSMLLVDPWCAGGIAEPPIELQSRNVVAFAGARPQRLVLEDRAVAAPIPHQPAFFQPPPHLGHRPS